MLSRFSRVRLFATPFVNRCELNCFWRRQWQPSPVLLPGKSHGPRSPVGCSPWGREESDMAERLLFHFSLSCIGEGNDNRLQYSCLENPRDGGAWWDLIPGLGRSPGERNGYPLQYSRLEKKIKKAG